MADRRLSRRRKRRRRRRMMRLTGAGVLLLGVLVLIFILMQEKSGTAFLMPYQSDIVYVSSDQVIQGKPELFAEHLCLSTDSAEPDAGMTAEAAAVYNRTTGENIYSKNGTEHLYPASVTKLMTCLLALEKGNLQDKVTVTEEMLSGLDPDSSVCGVQVGDTLTLEQLLYGLMLPSGNDAANAIAWHIGGSEAGFVELMNQRAHKLGMTDTHFMNAHGLNDENHYTTAYDLYLLLNDLLDSEEFMQIIQTQDYTADYMAQDGSAVRKEWHRGIWYFNDYAEAPQGITVLGGKTGTTPEAMFCLALTSRDDSGNEYVSVVLKAGTRDALYADMTALLAKIEK